MSHVAIALVLVLGQTVDRSGRSASSSQRTDEAERGADVGDQSAAVQETREAFDDETVAAAAAVAAPPASEPAEKRASCSTPRAAVEVLLHWLQPERVNARRAAACIDLRDRDEAAQRARQIKAVLDSRGLFVDVGALPVDAEHEDSIGEHRHQLFAAEARIYVEKVGERWVWSDETVGAIEALYNATFLVDLRSLVSRLPPWTQQGAFGVQLWQLLGLLLLLALGALARAAVQVITARWGRRLMRRFEVEWGDDLLGQMSRPVGTLTAAIVVANTLPALRLPVRLAQTLILAAQVVAAFSAVWALYRVVDLFTAWLEQRADRSTTRLDDQLVPLVRRALRIFIVAVGTIFVLQNMNVDVTGLVAGFSLGGVAVALAAKDTVANVFGSATIFGSKVFQIGDWVHVDGVEGVVESVGFRATKIRTFYNSLITVPNAKVADAAVDNYGARRYRRCKTVLGLTYDTTPEQMQAFVEGVRAIIKANPGTRKDTYEVHFNEFGASSLNVLLYFFFEVPTWSDELRERHNIFLEIMRLARELGVDFAFPTQTLHVESMAEAGAAAARSSASADELARAVAAFGPDGDKSRPGGPKITGGYLAG